MTSEASDKLHVTSDKTGDKSRDRLQVTRDASSNKLQVTRDKRKRRPPVTCCLSPVTGVAFLLVVSVCLPSPAWGATKVFSGGGNGTTWHDANNWFPAVVPTTGDAVTVDATNLAVSVQQNFVAQSITVGGKATSSLTVDAFVYGTVTPSTTSDPAIVLRKGGTVTLKGAGGTMTVKGSFKNSEESLPAEPSVMILLQ